MAAIHFVQAQKKPGKARLLLRLPVRALTLQSRLPALRVPSA